MEAFRLAADQGADGVELDVRRTADGELVVYHDPVVPGLGPIASASLAEVRQHARDAPSFAEAMEASAGMLVNVEIKADPGEPGFDPEYRAADDVAEWVAAHDAHDRVIVSSFNPLAVLRVRAEHPAVVTGLLMAPGSLGETVDVIDGIDVAQRGGHRALHPAGSQLAGEMAARAAFYARAQGLALVVWTVDDPTEIRRLAAAGIGGIITNDPAGALAALA